LSRGLDGLGGLVANNQRDLKTLEPPESAGFSVLDRAGYLRRASPGHPIHATMILCRRAFRRERRDIGDRRQAVQRHIDHSV